MSWIKKSVKDSGGFWTDHITENGQFLIAQGYEEWEKSQGRSWALFDCSKDSSWQILGYFTDLEEAKSKVASLEINSTVSSVEQNAS